MVISYFWVIMSSRKKVDSRIHTLIKNSVSLKHRSLFVVVGDHGRDQVHILVGYTTITS